MAHKESTYRFVEEEHGNGTFFFTDCCNNEMYSINNDPMAYHGKLCPKCFWKNQHVILYLRDTEDGIRVMKERKDLANKEDEV